MAARQHGKAPISRHPAFPAIVALWFAALLGLGSLVLPVVLIEALVRATGIASVVPAAEPPLGVTARITIALTAAALGALCGVVIARRVAGAQAAATQPRPKPGKHAMRPISASEELGSESLDAGFEEPAAPAFIGRRRALAVTDESGRSPWLDGADLPDDATVTVDAAPVAEPLAAEEPEPDTEPAEALELDQFADAQGEAETSLDEAGPLEAPAAFHDPAEPIFAVPELDAAPVVSSETPAPAAHDEEPEAMTDTFDPRPFAAPYAAPEPEPVHETEAESAPFAGEGADRGLAARALDDLSMAELVERFALSLRTAAQRQEEAAMAAAIAEPAPPPADDDETETARYVPDLGVAAEPAPRFAAETSDAPAPMPHAMQPVEAEDESEEEDVLDTLSLPLSSAARPFAQPISEFAPSHGTEDDDSGEDDDGFSSLLDLRSKLGSERDFVRIDDTDSDDAYEEAIEPAVVFPGQEARRCVTAREEEYAEASPNGRAGQRPFDAPGYPVSASQPVNGNQAERALRDALEKLQRMSGAV